MNYDKMKLLVDKRLVHILIEQHSFNSEILTYLELNDPQSISKARNRLRYNQQKIEQEINTYLFIKEEWKIIWII